MTVDELKALQKALDISDTQYAGMTPTSAADFLGACAAAKMADVAAAAAPLERYLLQLQIEAVRVHIAIDRAIAKEKSYALDVPPTPAFAQ